MSELTKQIEELEWYAEEGLRKTRRLEARIDRAVHWFCRSDDARMFGSMKTGRVCRIRELAFESEVINDQPNWYCARWVEGMAEDYGVSRRTIERDIQFLRKIGIVPAKTKGTE